MTACKLIEHLAKNVAQLGDVPVHIAYKNGVKYTKIEDFNFSVDIGLSGDAIIVLKENENTTDNQTDNG